MEHHPLGESRTDGRYPLSSKSASIKPPVVETLKQSTSYNGF
jgi:hypothetical protein